MSAPGNGAPFARHSRELRLNGSGFVGSTPVSDRAHRLAHWRQNDLLAKKFGPPGAIRQSDGTDHVF